MPFLQPKKSIKVKPRPPVSLPPCAASLGSSSTRHHHRLFRSLPQINQPRQANAQLPPIADKEPVGSSLPSVAATSAHLFTPRRSPPPFSPPSCYMLQEEEPWETCPPFAKIRPPPKVSRLDIGSTRLMRDCVYPQLPPLCTRRPPGATFDPTKPVGETVRLRLFDEAAGLVAPTQAAASFGELPEPLCLDLSNQPEGGCRSCDVGAQHPLPLSPSPLSTWTLETSDILTSRADRTQIGTSFHIRPPSPPPASRSPSTSTSPLPQPFDSTLSCLETNLQAHSLGQMKPGNTSLHPATMLSTHLPHLHGVKVESPGKRPELISKREARSITKMANQACKEPLGSLNNSELLASLSTRAVDRCSQDSLGDRSGLALALTPAAPSGQGILGSRLSSISTNRPLQNDVLRQMSPLHRATASYMVSTHYISVIVREQDHRFCVYMYY